MRAEDFTGSARRLDEAAATLRASAGEVVNFYGDLHDRLPRVRSWLGRLADDPALLGLGVPPVDTLLFAQAWHLAFAPDLTGPSFPAGTERAEAGWRVAEPAFWFGDVQVPGGLELGAPLIVLGSLQVDGLLDDGDVSCSHLAVAGDVRARAIASAADHFAVGSVSAAVIACFTNDGTLIVGRDIIADLFAPAEHAWMCNGTLRARAIGDAEHPRIFAGQLAPWLPADYVDPAEEDEPVDIWRILEEAAAERSPVLDGPRPAT